MSHPGPSLALVAILLVVSARSFATDPAGPLAGPPAGAGAGSGTEAAVARGAPSAAPAQSTLAAALAALPATERFVYARTTAGRRDKVDIRFSRKREGGQLRYELLSRSPDEDESYLLNPEDLSMIRSDITTRTATSVIHRTAEVLEDRSSLAPDELMLAANPPFLQRLRFLAFEKKPVYRILFQGAQSLPGFSLILSVSGREKIEVAGRSWDCWKLELGAKGVVGGLFGKSHYWYQAEWPHVLVRSEGPSSFPGSPLVRLELVSYETTP